MTPEELRKAVGRAIAPIAEVRTAWLFGSRNEGRPRLGSDLDVAVAYAAGLDADQREQVRRRVVVALTDSLETIGERADVVDVFDSDPAVAFVAVRDGALVLERDRDERCAAASRVARMYEDDGPRRALYRRAALDHARRPVL